MAEASPAAPAAADTAAAKPPRSKRLLIIIGAAVFAIAAAGTGAYFVFGHKSSAVPTKADAKTHAKETVEPKGPAIYVKLDPPLVVNFEAQGVMRFLQVTIEVMTRDQAVANVVKLNDPMIRNDLLLLFGNQQVEAINSREGKEKLRAEALQTVARIVSAEGGEGKKVEQLYFTSFVMQ
jgi:flagellar FliL protein